MGQPDVRIPDKLYFKIGEVSDITGIKPYVLRYWETEFPIGPKKSRTGQRLYRREDIEKVLEIRRLLYDEGFTISGARRHLAGHGGQEEEPEAPAQVEVAPEVPALSSNVGVSPPTFLLELRSRVATLRERIGELRQSAP